MRRSTPTASESGFTALELITVLAILAVVFTIVTSLFISFNQQTTNTQDSVVGIQEETQAQQTLVQYLRGASQLLAIYGAPG
jgi:prepilin-type N-terminal cleavage/methylation domain-containing protein